MSERIVSGNKVFFDDVRGRWTVLFTATNTRQQYDLETEALAAASASPGVVKDKGAGVVPKQAIDNALSKRSNAVKQLDDQVKVSINHRVAAEGSTLNVKVGTEKDGFTSLTAATTKGNANEGPAIAVMGSNIKQGNVTKTVSATAKLNSVTGGTKGQSAVLNETVVQASPKGITKALKTVVKLNDKQVEASITESSPIPSQAKSAVQVELQGGVAKKAGQNAAASSVKVSAEIQKPFGSINPFGSIGSTFGNIMAQIVSTATVGGSYSDPLKSIKAAGTSTVKDYAGQTISTPNISNANGTTNLTGAITRSKLENGTVKRLSDTIKPGQRTQGWTGINTKLKGYNYGKWGEDHPDFKGLKEREAVAGVAEGGNYLIPMLYGKADLTAELKLMEREFTTVVVRHHVMPLSRKYEAEDIHVMYREVLNKGFGAKKVASNPKAHIFPAHLFINSFGNVKIITPFESEIPLVMGEDPVGDNIIPGAIHVFIEGSAHPDSGNKISQHQLKILKIVCKYIVEAFPGVEVLGLKDLSDIDKYRNIPYFNVRDFMQSSFDKASVTEENEKAVVPPAKDLVDAKPKNVVLPPKPHTVNARPSTNKIATIQNKAAAKAPTITPAQYQANQIRALDLLKSKKDAIAAIDTATGSGLTTQIGIAKLSAGTSLSSNIPGISQSLVSQSIGGPIGNIAGSIVGSIARSVTNSDSLLKSTQEFKLDNLKLNKVYDSVKGIFKDG